MDKSEQLEPGDLAIVLRSASGSAVGKIVTCVQIDCVDHPKYGTLWLVEADRPLSTTQGVLAKTAHLPQSWMKKIPRDPLPDEEDTVIKDRELEAV